MGKRKRTAKTSKKNCNGATLGFEATLWLAADKLRNNMDAAEYKHVVLGLIFLKYISDAFEEQHTRLLAEVDEQHFDLPAIVRVDGAWSVHQRQPVPQRKPRPWSHLSLVPVGQRDGEPSGNQAPLENPEGDGLLQCRW